MKRKNRRNHKKEQRINSAIQRAMGRSERTTGEQFRLIALRPGESRKEAARLRLM